MGKHRSKKAINNQKQFLDISYRDLNDEQFYRIIKNHPFLKILYCTNNKITNVDHLPGSLRKIHCSYKQITNMDHLPPKLQLLYCHNNQITNLDYSPAKLKILVCSNNQITNLDYLPPTLQELYCANNPLINKLNNTDLYIKRSNWLRFRRDKHNEACERKTRAYLILREIRNTSQFYENCLPHCIIRHIVDFI